ncbi:MAG: NUDIX domain-containing protein [Bacteroidota bacterium]|nr:NUDIX domain-containing protein [Bacteroidota bacterium]MDP4234296.1 NUDIX domain-containing protein [Bacteroidota bacterium]MDP4243231.1 NUDIX domain-containing protein [Bacteroidota bacterium]MDP4288063.1 NUDIX domain-containing protein [Bacteroidota bacterium]
MKTIGVFAAIFDDEHRILLVRLAYGNQSWTTRGGAFEHGETIEEVLKREVIEESGY